MKITPVQYARSLFEATKGKSAAEIDGLAENFVKVLLKNGQLGKNKTIIEKFEEISDRENNFVKAEITTREKMDEETRESLRGFIKNKYQAEEVFIEEKIDRAIRGGMIIQVADEIFDASVRRQLEKLKENMQNN